MKSTVRKMIIFSVIVFGVNACHHRQMHRISGSGTLEATEVLVSAKAAGTITDLWVKEGDLVQIGQMLAQIDSEKVFLTKKQLQAGLEELHLNLVAARRNVQMAQDQLSNTEKKYLRVKSLLAEGSATQQQYDDLETAFKAAATQYENARTALAALNAKETQLRAQLELCDSQLRDTKVTAPITGTVIEKYVERGEIVRPSGPIVNLADLENMWIKIYVKETDLARLRLNAPAELKISAYPDRVFPGRVAWIASKAEFIPKNVQTKEARSDLVYAVKIEVKNGEQILKIGMPADVTIQ